MQNGPAVFARRLNPSSHRPSREVGIALGFLLAACTGTGCLPAAPTEGGGSGGASTATGGAAPGSGGATPPGSGGATQGSGGAPEASGGKPGSGGAASGGMSGGSGGRNGSGGAPEGTGGRANTGGTPGGSGGAGGRANTGGTPGGSGGSPGTLAKFSFFVTSVDAMKMLSNNAQGFGADLRFGETGDGAGLKGADKICSTIADMSMPGASAKGWRAFLSAPAMGSMPVVNAIERIGNGPWYDRMGRLFSANKANLIGFRPSDADATIKNDFPNEYGIPNHSDGAPGCTGNACPDNHDTLTGTNDQGMLIASTTTNPNPTCDGWTNKTGTAGKPHVGHSWPRMPSSNNTCTAGGGFPGGGGGGTTAPNAGCYGHWMSSLDEAGCALGISLVEMGAPNPNNPTVGSGGGYGGIFCFALMP